MTHPTKKYLAKRHAELLDENYNLEGERNSALGMLHSLGYEKKPNGYTHSDGTPHLTWQKDEDLLEVEKAEAENRERVIQNARNGAIVQTRRKTLAAVIDALEIKGYPTTSGMYVSLIASPQTDLDKIASPQTDPDKIAALKAEQEELVNSRIDAFWADIQTALQVRADRKAQEIREKTEAKVAGLLKKDEPKPGLASGGYVSAGMSIFADQDSGATFATKPVQLSEQDRALLEQAANIKAPEKKKADKK